MWKTILAVMLHLATPGTNVFSRVPINSCDAKCQKTPLCADGGLICKPPTFDKYLFKRIVTRFRNEGLSTQAAMKKARLQAYTRPETYDETLVRYKIIAQAIDQAAKRSTRSICDNNCNNAPTISREACYNQCKSSAPWTWKRRELAFMLVTLADREGGLRSDIQSGRKRGDCQWAYINGKRASPGAKNAYPIPGTCASVCLTQNRVGKGITREGWRANDLVGLDINSTRRCMMVSALNLTLARNYCASTHPKIGWTKATFTEYGTGHLCLSHMVKKVWKNGIRYTYYAYLMPHKKIVWAPFAPDNAVNKSPLQSRWPIIRSGIFWHYQNSKETLPQNIENELAKPELQQVYNQLLKQKLLYMPVIATAVPTKKLAYN